ncbi:MAG: hypothetical protein MI674_07350 [Cytophagales bacterium]|nr:hypothetical protein [Cytophagales bacterium]
MSSSVLLLLTCCKKKLIQEPAQDILVSMEQGDDANYRFRDNALEWRLCGSPPPCRGSEENYTELNIILGYSKDEVALSILDITPKWLITYSRSNALGPLEDEDCMKRLFEMLVGKQNHSAIAQDLLENTNLALREKEQRKAALILESIVSLLRTEIQQGFRDYLGKIREGKVTFSGDTMNNFLREEKNGNDRIALNQFEYRFGDNVEAILRNWESLIRGKEYVVITSRSKVDIAVKSSAENTTIDEQLAEEEAYYSRLVDELKGGRADQDSLLARDLLKNTDYTICTYRQKDAAAALEAIIALAEGGGKHEAVNSFRSQLQAVGEQGGELDFIKKMMRKAFKEEYYKVYGHGTEGESEEDENYYLGDEDEYSK